MTAPLYDPATRILHFVDILENKVRLSRLNMLTLSFPAVPFFSRCTTSTPTTSNSFLRSFPSLSHVWPCGETARGWANPLPGFLMLAYHQQLACAAARGFALLEGNSVLRYISKPLPEEHVPHIRFNDGACDSKGRFFAGTLCSKEHNIAGKLYRYDPADGSCVVVDEGPFTVSGHSFAHNIIYFWNK
jgi:sugar lactone lactonase YvrE